MNIFKRLVYAIKLALNETKHQSMEDEFINEVAKRRLVNKKIFISTTKKFLKKKCIEQTGCKPKDQEVEMIALKIFNEAKRKGDVDLLYNLKGEHND